MTEHPCRRTLRAPPGRARGASACATEQPGSEMHDAHPQTCRLVIAHRQQSHSHRARRRGKHRPHHPRGGTSRVRGLLDRTDSPSTDKAPVTPPAFADVHYIMLNINHEDVHYCTLDWFAYGIGLGWGGSQPGGCGRPGRRAGQPPDRRTHRSTTALRQRSGVSRLRGCRGWTYGALATRLAPSIGAHTDNDRTRSYCRGTP